MPIPRWRLRFAILAVACAPIHPLLAQTEAEVNAGIKKFTQIYEAVEANFADRVEADQVVFKGAIPGMLRTLDPHSNFFDPKAYQLLREGQSGHYYGVGMYVGAPEGKVVVMYPFEGSPATRSSRSTITTPNTPP
jgi:carboxyl-terminal processing protease